MSFSRAYSARTTRGESRQGHDQNLESEDADDSSRGSSDSDIRISKLARTMARLESEDSFAKACGQIEDLIQRSNENRKYVVRSFHCLTIPFNEAIQGLTGVPWRVVGIHKYSDLLLRIVNSMETQLNRVWQWLIDLIDKKARNHKHLEHACIAQEILLNMIPKLNKTQNKTLINSIQEGLEQAPNANVFKIYCTVFINCLLPFKETKSSHFQDFVDIVIGWMVDENEDSKVVPLFCSEVLKHLEPYFRKDTSFTKSLLTQILEDMEDSSKMNESCKNEKIIKATRLLRAYSSIVNLSCHWEKEFLSVSCERLFSKANLCLKPKDGDDKVPKLRYELLCGMNEFISTCRGADGVSVRYFLKEELKLFITNDGWRKWPMIVLNDFFLALISWVETIVTINQPNDEVKEIFKETMKFLDLIQFSLSTGHQQKVVRIVQGLLRTRNVVMLQTVYEWLTGKLGEITIIENNNYSKKDLEKKLFVLACLSDIATNKTGSILSLWALTPPIFDLFMSLMEGCGVDRICLLELLRAHCSAHSHFVSSIALSRNYLAESPCTRFLSALMKFWTERMLKQKLTPPLELWIFSWISDFIKSSAHYSALLLETEQIFYKTVVRQLVERPRLRENLAVLLTWMTDDPHYQKSEFILTLVRDTCIRILLKEEREYIKELYSNLFQRIPFLLLIEPEFKDHVSYIEDYYVAGPPDENIPSFTIPDFNNFLYDLFVSDKNDISGNNTDGNSTTNIKAAVEYLIQSKLKTTVGRPQEFFFHLQNMLKRYRSAKVTSQGKLPCWKLAFVYELERRLICCIFESSFVSSGISEALRTFYLTNRTPCIEWLKRMRADLIELSLVSKHYPAVYYYATLSGDELKARYALLELEDLEGLSGLSEMAGFHYLKSEYEKVRDVLKDVELDFVKNAILRRTDTILKIASGDFQNWENAEQNSEISQDFMFKIPSSKKTFLNIQLDGVLEGKHYPVDLYGELDNISQYELLDLVKVRGLVKRIPDRHPSQILSLDCIIVNRMIDLGNITFVREWLIRHNWSDMEGKMNSNPRVKAEYFLILAEVLYHDLQWEQSAKMYVSLLKLFETEENFLSNGFKSQVLLKFARKLISSEEFYTGVAQSSLVLNGLETRAPLIQSILDKAAHMSPINATVWFQYADFSYKRAQREDSVYLKEVYKTNASQCYDRVIHLEGKSRHSKMSMLAMTRLIKLHKEGNSFNAEEVIIDHKWLTLLPELAHLEEFRAHLLNRFPEQATFLIATYVKPQKFQRFAQRRGVFEPAAYSFTEANEEMFHGACQNSLCEFPTQEWLRDVEMKFQMEESLAVRELRAVIPNDVSMMVQEMERIGTSREELWSWSVQRVAGDWSKRLAVLRKDLARESSLEKLKAYIAPVRTYLCELWNETKECETPSELAFVCRNGASINLLLDRLRDCMSADDLEEIFDILLKYVTTFDSVNCSKLALSNLSPKLFNFDFIGSPSAISLPGFRPGVTVSSIHSLVTCLATKTKPKRLVFRGSDGNKYEYLVKGNENLNIDCRIMQLLKAMENFTEYPTRTYSVTPLGDRGGLIQIVEEAMPLFTLYKKYLSRNTCSERPSEMFWRRLGALGFSDRSNKDALLNVFDELVEETSSDLLSRELFLCAEDTKGWYNSVRTFTRDCAVGSCIGYFVGVGDRHLDNILLNPSKGHLVHVDFSILFGKGASLRIPEKVPFRMTQNFACALQYPGLPGPFRAHLDNLLHQFKDNEEIVEFCVESIAFAYQLEDSLPIDPRILLSAELRSALTLLRHRASDISDFMQLVMRDVLEACTDPRNSMNVWTTRLDTLTSAERIIKKIYRWRRLLANIDPLIQFVSSYAQPIGPMSIFQELVVNEWTPNVMHFWSHTKIEQVTSQTSVFAQRFDFTETTLQLLLHHIPSDEMVKPKEFSFANSNCQQVDTMKIRNVMICVNEKISSVSPATATELIDIAVEKDNLAQMYEGWTSWV